MNRRSARLTRLEKAWRLALVERLAAEVAAADDLTVEEVLAEAHALLEEDARTEEELLAEARTEAARTPRTAPGSQGVHGLQ